MFIVDPRYLSFPRWADSVIVDNGSLPQAARDEDSWKAWAAEVALIDSTAPDPMPFAHWRSWALAWIETQ